MGRRGTCEGHAGADAPFTPRSYAARSGGHRHPGLVRRRETLPPAAKLWGYAQDWTVAYGYRPGRAALWMAVLWAASAIAFSRADHPPLKPGEHPNWNPSLFALDLLLPVINLGQDSYWQLRGGWQWLAAALILLGWILATTVAAGATRLLRRS